MSVSNESNTPYQGYKWCARGDVNAFFGLMLDNLTGLFFLVILLSGFGFPTDFAIAALVPGTALGVLVGDLAFVWIAFRLSKRKRSSDVTAMPLGLDTPSVFGITLFILGPSFREGVDALGLSPTDAAYRTWHIGIWCIVLSGILKLALAPATNWVRTVVPRAGLLGSLAAIALVLISFIPLSEILGHPLPGLVALAIVLTTLIARVEFPGRLPGTLGALLVAGLLYYLMCGLGIDGYKFPTLSPVEWFPTRWLESWQLAWISDGSDALHYLPIALPFAIATVVGGIDCTESAAAAGDTYDTRTVIAVEAVATLVAGLSGGVIQTTPYIGHPAYKAMGGRAAYTLGTALLIGSAGLIGYFTVLNDLIPKPAVMPILVFIGLEITAQSFAATPKRHYAAVAFACLPALAVLALNLSDQILGDPALAKAGLSLADLKANLQENYATITMLSSGFILTSLLWAWGLAASIDHRLKTAGVVFLVCAGLTLFGLIHSPLAGSQLFVPAGPAGWGDIVLAAEKRSKVFEFAGGYALIGVLLLLWTRLIPSRPAGDAVTDRSDGLD
ncbi:permease [Roseiconus nitratireducens]|uniref:Permease n=1 Tax=Roseiconus nitratireducens TaxID=2605748 RepID=A0A5M6DDD9_9BACT|nr:permease [Roseiconus nitratireducens]KAA5545534.1 permease [Roseiconus nitratireducens]